MRESLGAGDEVDIGAAKQRRQELLGKRHRCAFSVWGAAHCLAAVNCDRASAKVFLHIQTKRVELGTIKSRRDKGANAGRGGFISLLSISGELSNAHQCQEDAGQD